MGRTWRVGKSGIDLMSDRPNEVVAFAKEISISFVAAILAAFLISSKAAGRIDEALVAFLAILAGAALPGMALTAAAPRPPLETPLEAQVLGGKLEAQVRFWFSYILLGGAASISVLGGRALNWELHTPRPSFIPSFIPDGGAWLVGLATLLTVLTGVRMRHVVGAVLDLVRLGTKAHVAQTLDRRRAEQNVVAEQIRNAPKDADRGSPVARRERL